MRFRVLKVARLVSTFCSLLCAGVAGAGFGGTDLFLPSVGAKPGVPPSVWYTTVWVHNPNATAANVTFYLLERQANLSPMAFTDTIQGGDTARYENAIQLMFGKQTFGALRLTSNVRIMAGSRIYSQSGELVDSVGQYFAATPASFAIGVGQSTELLGVYGTLPSADSTFRYNFGFVETTGVGSCQVKVTAKTASGVKVGEKTYAVKQWEQMQKAFKDEFPSVSTSNARLTVAVTSGTGKVIGFGSGVANGSQDPTTFEMAFRDELLAENSSGSGLTQVAHDTTLTGAGTSASPLGLAAGAVGKAKLAAPGGTTGQSLVTDGKDLFWRSIGFTLPYKGTGSSASNTELFFINNTGDGRAMQLKAEIDTALWVNSTYGLAIDARSTNYHGVHGMTSSSDRAGLLGTTSIASGYGVHGDNASALTTGWVASSESGVMGQSWAPNGIGTIGIAHQGSGAVGIYGNSNNGWAGKFSGKVSVIGAFSKSSGSFKIDHPLDPEGKYLYHSFVESPDMKNVYDGNVVTDERGFATVSLPDWFEALNRDFRYQLTVLGGGIEWVLARVAREISGNAFVIQTSAPGTKVSWQVTGIRQDAWANAHRIQVEEEKPQSERGTFIHPEVFGQPEEKGVEWAIHPALMRQSKADRDGATNLKR
jgi:hypothetical protein